MLKIDCSGCKREYKVQDQFAGRKMKCKSCGTPIRIPALEVEAPAEVEPVVSEEPAASEAAPTRKKIGKKFGKKAGGASGSSAGGKKFGKKIGKKAGGKIGAASSGRKAGSKRPARDTGEAAAEGSSNKIVVMAVGLVVVAALVLLFVLDPLGWFGGAQDPENKDNKVAGKDGASEKGKPSDADDDDDSDDDDDDEIAKAGDDDDGEGHEDEDEDEEGHEDDDDDADGAELVIDNPLDVMPADAGIVARIDLEALQAAAASLGLEEQIPDVEERLDLAVKAFTASAPFPEQMMSESVPKGLVAVVDTGEYDTEGTEGELLSSEATTIHGFPARVAPEDENLVAVLINSKQFLMGERSGLGGAISLANDGGDSVTSNSMLSKLTDDFGMESSAAWIAADVPAHLTEMIKAQASQDPQLNQILQMVNLTEVPDIKGALIALSHKGDNFELQVRIGLGNEDQSKKLVALVAGIGSPISPINAMLPPPAKELLKKLKAKPNGDRFDLTLTMSSVEIQEGIAGMMQGVLEGGGAAKAERIQSSKDSVLEDFADTDHEDDFSEFDGDDDDDDIDMEDEDELPDFSDEDLELDEDLEDLEDLEDEEMDEDEEDLESIDEL